MSARRNKTRFPVIRRYFRTEYRRARKLYRFVTYLSVPRGRPLSTNKKTDAQIEFVSQIEDALLPVAAMETFTRPETHRDIFKTAFSCYFKHIAPTFVVLNLYRYFSVSRNFVTFKSKTLQSSLCKPFIIIPFSANILPLDVFSPYSYNAFFSKTGYITISFA